MASLVCRSETVARVLGFGQSGRIGIGDRISADIEIEIGAVIEAGRIGAEPSAEGGHVVTRAEVIQPRRCVALFADVTVHLQRLLAGRDRWKRRRDAVGVVFLIADDAAGVVELDGDRAQERQQRIARQLGVERAGFAAAFVDGPAILGGECTAAVALRGTGVSASPPWASRLDAASPPDEVSP